MELQRGRRQVNRTKSVPDPCPSLQQTNLHEQPLGAAGILGSITQNPPEWLGNPFVTQDFVIMVFDLVVFPATVPCAKPGRKADSEIPSPVFLPLGVVILPPATVVSFYFTKTEALFCLSRTGFSTWYY